MNQIDKQMLMIKSIDPGASLEFSDFTEAWFVNSSIWIYDDGALQGFSEHEETPELAVSVFLDKIKAVQGDEYLVTGFSTDSRRHYRWNGVAFAEVF